jgi:hypothetical protein
VWKDYLVGKFHHYAGRTCKAISLDGTLPTFMSTEIAGYCQDLEHGLTLELDAIRPETQVTIANILRDALDAPERTLDLGRRAQGIDPTADMGTGVPLLGVGKGLAIPVGWLKLGGNVKGDVAIWATNLTTPSKASVTGVTLRVTIYRW